MPSQVVKGASVPVTLRVSSGITVTSTLVGIAAVQPSALAKFTLIHCAPEVFQVTVTAAAPFPSVIVPPDETAHVYPVIPGWVVYSYGVFLFTDPFP